MQKTILTKDFECKHTNLVQQENSFKSFIYSLLLYNFIAFLRDRYEFSSGVFGYHLFC